MQCRLSNDSNHTGGQISGTRPYDSKPVPSCWQLRLRDYRIAVGVRGLQDLQKEGRQAGSGLQCGKSSWKGGWTVFRDQREACRRWPLGAIRRKGGLYQWLQGVILLDNQGKQASGDYLIVYLSNSIIACLMSAVSPVLCGSSGKRSSDFLLQVYPPYSRNWGRVRRLTFCQGSHYLAIASDNGAGVSNFCVEGL